MKIDDNELESNTDTKEEPKQNYEGKNSTHANQSIPLRPPSAKWDPICAGITRDRAVAGASGPGTVGKEKPLHRGFRLKHRLDAAHRALVLGVATRSSKSSAGVAGTAPRKEGVCAALVSHAWASSLVHLFDRRLVLVRSKAASPLEARAPFRLFRQHASLALRTCSGARPAGAFLESVGVG